MVLIFVMQCGAAVHLHAAQPSTLSVNCNTGDDINGDGTAARPLRSLMRARDLIRQLQVLPEFHPNRSY